MQILKVEYAWYDQESSQKKVIEDTDEEKLTSNSPRQVLETRISDSAEALSQQTESNGSAQPNSRRHPLTIPTDRLIEDYIVIGLVDV